MIKKHDEIHNTSMDFILKKKHIYSGPCKENLCDEGKENFDSGAVRSKLENVRYDLISIVGIRRLAETYAEGSKKYSDDNWRKGIPFSNLMNHLLTHIFNYLEGIETEEDSLAHACWGLMALMEQEDTHPEMNDLFFHKQRKLYKIIKERCRHPEELCGSVLPDGSYKCCGCNTWFKKELKEIKTYRAND